MSDKQETWSKLGSSGPWGSETSHEKNVKEFQDKNNLSHNTSEQNMAGIKTRIGQIERDRRASKVPGEKYPPHGELSSLRNRMKELRSKN